MPPPHQSLPTNPTVGFSRKVCKRSWFGIDDTPAVAGLKAKAVDNVLFASFRYYIPLNPESQGFVFLLNGKVAPPQRTAPSFIRHLLVLPINYKTDVFIYKKRNELRYDSTNSEPTVTIP